MIKKIILTAVLLGMVFLYGVYSTYGSTPFLRKSYPIEAWWVKKSIDCQSQSKFLQRTLDYIIDQHGSLSNQLVYLKKNGQLNTCVSGSNVTDSTRFRYASLTKVLTAALFLEQEKENRVQRNAPLSQFVPLHTPIDQRMYQIQLKSLLTHSAGFDRIRSNDPIIQEGKSWCPTHLEQLNHIYLDHEPNTVYSYDNRNYCLLGTVLAQVSGQSFQMLMNNYLKQHNFTHIKFLDGPFLADEVKYDFRFEEYYFPNYTQKYDFKAMQPAAGLSGSAKDYAQLINYFMQQRQLPLTETVLEIKNTDKKKVYTSIALRQKITQSGEKVSYHFGALPASRSLVLIRSNGDVMVWTGSGVPQNPKINETQLLDYILIHLD